MLFINSQYYLSTKNAIMMNYNKYKQLKTLKKQMNIQKTTLDFLTYFCNSDINRISDLLDDKFHFKGPFIEFDSKESYITSLEENPPINCQIEVQKIFTEGDEVGVFYIFNKENINTPMAQYFKFNKNKIMETLLVFDSKAFDTAT